MKLKLDENLGHRGAELFNAAGHDSSTVAQQGLLGADDRTLIGRCREEQRCLVTLDLDFGNPLLFEPREYAGIAVLRLPSNPSPDHLLEGCRTLIAGLAENDITGKLWIIQRHRIREYRPENLDSEE